MKQFIIIFIGGGLGACSRYLIGSILQANLSIKAPWGFISTVFINIVGALFLGAFTQLSYAQLVNSQWIKQFVVIGFLGAFTTFSTFTFDAFELWHRYCPIWAILYMLFSCISCFLAIIMGMQLIKWLSLSS